MLPKRSKTILIYGNEDFIKLSENNIKEQSKIVDRKIYPGAWRASYKGPEIKLMLLRRE